MPEWYIDSKLFVGPNSKVPLLKLFHGWSKYESTYLVPVARNSFIRIIISDKSSFIRYCYPILDWSALCVVGDLSCNVDKKIKDVLIWYGKLSVHNITNRQELIDKGTYTFSSGNELENINLARLTNITHNHYYRTEDAWKYIEEYKGL